MDPHTVEPGPELAAFADAMRGVLRTRHDAPTEGPDAIETWRPGDGYEWRWSTAAGMWRVTAGSTMDPRPLLHGPAGIWRIDAPADPAGADLVLPLLRAAGALPLPAAARRLAARHGYAVIRGHRFPARGAEPLRAVLYRPSDPTPIDLPAGYVAVRTLADEPDEHGRWVVVMPDGYQDDPDRRSTAVYDPARRCLVPYANTAGGTSLLLLDADQLTGEQTHRAAA